MKNKVAYITGGSKGIGFGIADALMKEGVNVAITSRSQSSADEAVELLKSSNSAAKAIGIEADVRSMSSQQEAVDKILKEFGQLDYVIANAGIGHYHSIEDLTEEQWNETIDTNLTGVFFSIKASVEALKKSKGYFITISSLAGTNFFAKGSSYNASKFGLTGFTQAVMLDLRDHGVNVSTIMPGSVATHFNGNTPDESDSWKIQPEDLGEIVVDLFKMHPRTLPSKIEVRPSQPSKK
ncbi:SDR family oxidoreductase [Psychroflexus sediminis]|uniref:NAD(P)-dependent dehydrogenase, short-chain alcohol dehydrogenase family n=1 Tax=Psychroflexus sediminis TaxID=470826 RepID=A0A1G7XPB4_9FLAO|nr:SDR family oxidoreductase [Psychroflexus sediminis]SDG85863.1 NAD(P)-dependent dehydrogenase, short-chain alcohol dehydrogenase family [Psychroflexus sediminis]